MKMKTIIGTILILVAGMALIAFNMTPLTTSGIRGPELPVWGSCTRLSHTLTKTGWTMVAANDRYDPDYNSWPMHAYDPACTGYSPSIAPDTNATAWIANLPGGTVWAYPVVAEGRVFVGAGGYLNAFDENTGSLVWRFGALGQPGYPCETVVADGRVFFGTKEPGPGGYIYALSTTTGEELWRFATEGYLQANPAIVGDRLYFGGYYGSNQGKIYCVNAITGASLWNFTTQDRPATIAVAYEKVYVSTGHWETSTTAAIYCLNMYNGNVVWSKGTSRDVASTLSVANGKAYWAVSDENGGNLVFYALNATNGNEVWEVTRYSSGEGGRIAVAYGKVFFGTGGGAARGVYALNETNGNEIWAFPVSQKPAGGPVVADGKVFFAQNYPGHLIFALNETTKSIIWEYRLGGSVHSQSSAIAHGRVFVADHFNSKLYAFGPQYTGPRSSLTVTTTTGGTTSPPPETYNYTNGTIASVTAIPDTGYALYYWELDGLNVGSENPKTTSMNHDHTLRAVFAQAIVIAAHCHFEEHDIGVNIILDGLPTGYTTPQLFNLTGAHNFTVPDTDLNGHLFMQWSTGETSRTIGVTSNGTYTAYYNMKHNLTITTTVGGTTNPSPGNYSYWGGTEATVTAVPTLGHLFDHWELDGTNVSASDTVIVTMNANHNLNAVFSGWVGICNLTITTTSGGTTNPSPGTYNYTNGTIASITATAAAPYYFFCFWLLDGQNVSNTNPKLVAMHSNHTLHATFHKDFHGGCPFLYVYDGEEYASEGLLGIDSPAGPDKTANRTLRTQPERVHDTYVFQLVESQITVSHVDQVVLCAVLEDGTEVKLSLASAWHKDQGNVLPQLMEDDGWRTDLLGARWTNDGESQSIQLAFSALTVDIRIKAFIFYIDGNASCSPAD